MSLQTNQFKSSLEALNKDPLGAGELFFQQLFSLSPKMKSMFENIDMGPQAKVFSYTLIEIIQLLDNPKKLSPFLSNLGSRHLDYGAKDDYYPFFKQAITQSLAIFLKAQWNKSSEKSWNQLMDHIIAGMKNGQSLYDEDSALAA